MDTRHPLIGGGADPTDSPSNDVMLGVHYGHPDVSGDVPLASLIFKCIIKPSLYQGCKYTIIRFCTYLNFMYFECITNKIYPFGQRLITKIT